MTAQIKQFPIKQQHAPEVDGPLTVVVRCGNDTLLELPIDAALPGLYPAPCELAIVRAALNNALTSLALAFDMR